MGSEPKLAENKGDTLQSKDVFGQTLNMNMVSCAKKPSERFVRRPLKAKSRASQSERFRIATQKEKLNTLPAFVANAAEVFKGYRPGHEIMPG